MTPRQFLKTRSEKDIEKLAEKAGTTVGNLRSIAYQNRASRKMAEKLAKASGGLMSEMEILYPERYE